MTLIVCPDRPPFPRTTPLVFLAGGITGCEDWQTDFAERFDADDTSVILANPRRAEFGDVTDPVLGDEQIGWECEYLDQAEHVIFWFPNTAACIMTQHELGGALERERIAERSGKPERRVLIGVELGYMREFDVHTQARKKTPWIDVVDNLDDLYYQLDQRL